jgi:CubicO group peptidase (beta-lactamase class C family)
VNRPPTSLARATKLLSRIAIMMALASGLSLPGAVAAAADTQVYPRIEGIDQLANATLTRKPLAGVSVAVMREGKLIHAAGYGFADLEQAVPATPLTVYRIASVTKQFTAALVLRLAERGEIDLDADIRKYLPDFDTGGRKVTVTQLLNHTSGIADLTRIPAAMAQRCLDLSVPEVFAYISKEPFDFEPGEQFRYNNSGFWLLGVIIERVTGKPYSQAIRELLLGPLGLDRTRYDEPARIIARRARGYALVGKELQNSECNSPTRPYASGALLSTVMDLLDWQQGLFSGKAVGAALQQRMITRGRLNSGAPIPYGFGLALSEFRGAQRIAHPGGIVGFSAFLSHYPEQDLTIAVIANTMGVELRTELEEPIAALLLTPDR